MSKGEQMCSWFRSRGVNETNSSVLMTSLAHLKRGRVVSVLTVSVEAEPVNVINVGEVKLTLESLKEPAVPGGEDEDGESIGVH